MELRKHGENLDHALATVIVGAQPRDRSVNKPCGYPTDKQSGMVSIISEDVRGSLRQVIADSYVTDE